MQPMSEWTVNGDKCTRRLGFEEGLISNLTSLMNGNSWLTSFIWVEFDEPDEEKIAGWLKQAWKQIVLENPCLNSIIYSDVDSPGNPRMETYLVDTQEKLEAWADETFIVDTKADTARDYFKVKHRLANNKWVLVWVKKSSELVIDGPHAVNDSYGCLLTFNRLLEWYSKANPAAVSAETLIPRLIWPTQSRLNCKPVKLDSMADCLAANFLGKDIPTWIESVQKMGGLPSTKNLDNPGLAASHDSRVIIMDYTAEETLRVIANAKKHGATVGEFLWAASVTSMGRFPENKGKFFVTLSTTDFRFRLVDNPPCAGMHVGGWPIAIPITPLLQENVKWVREYMQKYLPLLKCFPEDDHPEFDEAVAAYELFNRNAITVAQEMAVGFTQMVSSLGVVDKFIKPRYDGVKVKRTNVVGLTVAPGNHNLWSTFDGKLCASYCFNEAFHTFEDLQEHADCVKGILLNS